MLSAGVSVMKPVVDAGSSGTCLFFPTSVYRLVNLVAQKSQILLAMSSFPTAKCSLVLSGEIFSSGKEI